MTLSNLLLEEKILLPEIRLHVAYGQVSLNACLDLVHLKRFGYVVHATGSQCFNLICGRVHAADEKDGDLSGTFVSLEFPRTPDIRLCRAIRCPVTQARVETGEPL